MKNFSLLILSLLAATFNYAQNVGINEANPTNSLHIKPITLGDNPLRVEGLQAYTIGDSSILVINPNSGIVKYMNASELSNSLLNSTVINNISDSLISNSTFINNFGDSLFLSQNFIDSLTSHLYNNGDTLLYNSSFINSLRDSIDTDVDSITLTGTTLHVYENGNDLTADLSTLSDNDSDPTNEYNTGFSLSGSVLQITDGGGTYTTDLAPLIYSVQTPVGAIFAFPTINPPSGYLACNGQAISRTTYNNLFSLIGTMYGTGDGSTTFNLPNYNGQFLRGVDNGEGIDPDAASRTDRGDGTTGDVVGTKQSNETLAHNHSVDPPSTNTNTTGAHTHSIDPPSTTTSTNGNHRHHTPTITRTIFDHTGGGSGYGQDTPSGTGPNVYTNTTGDHNHTVNIPAFNSASSGDHSHSVDIAQFNSGNNGGAETRPTNITVLWCIKF